MIEFKNKIELINLSVKSLYDEIMEKNPDGNPFINDACYAFVPPYLRGFFLEAYRAEKRLAIKKTLDKLRYHDLEFLAVERKNNKWRVIMYDPQTKMNIDYYV